VHKKEHFALLFSESMLFAYFWLKNIYSLTNALAPKNKNTQPMRKVGASFKNGNNTKKNSIGVPIEF